MSPETEKKETPHISPSQLGMYARCGEQYRRRYICGDIIPPNMVQIRGRSVHKARKANLRQKKETRKDLPADQVVETARDAVDADFHGEVSLDVGQTIGSAKGEALDSAVRLAQCDYDYFQKDIQPTMVEERITVVIPGLGRDILGILDTADQHGVVRDLKTAGKSPSAGAADKSDQLTTYALLYKTAAGKLPDGVQLDTVVNLKIKPKAVASSSTRTDADLDVIVGRYHVTIKAIEAGTFVPCPSDFWMCSPKWCGYYETCPYVRRGQNRPVS